MVDLGKELGKGQTGRLVIGKEKFWCLEYADDIVLLATSEEELKEMMERLEKYLDRKKLILSEGKSKVMVCRKSGERKKNSVWRWKDKEIEEVVEFSYFGYVFKSSRSCQGQIDNLVKKATIVCKST